MSTDNSAFFLLNKKIQEWIYKNEWEELRPAQVESIKEIRQKLIINHLFPYSFRKNRSCNASTDFRIIRKRY